MGCQVSPSKDFVGQMVGCQLNTRCDVFVNSIPADFRNNIQNRRASCPSTASHFNKRLDRENRSSSKPEKCIVARARTEMIGFQTTRVLNVRAKEGEMNVVKPHAVTGSQ